MGWNTPQEIAKTDNIDEENKWKMVRRKNEAACITFLIAIAGTHTVRHHQATQRRRDRLLYIDRSVNAHGTVNTSRRADRMKAEMRSIEGAS